MALLPNAWHAIQPWNADSDDYSWSITVLPLLPTGDLFMEMPWVWMFCSRDLILLAGILFMFSYHLLGFQTGFYSCFHTISLASKLQSYDSTLDDRSSRSILSFIIVLSSSWLLCCHSSHVDDCHRKRLQLCASRWNQARKSWRMWILLILPSRNHGHQPALVASYWLQMSVGSHSSTL